MSNKDRLRVVLFTPDDLFLVKGSAGKRRAFLDFFLKQISDEYRFNLENYSSILKGESTAKNRKKPVAKLFR